MKKTIIITGANSGLGFESAKKIAMVSNDFHLILACRNMEKAKQAKKKIIQESGNPNVICMELDTSSLDSVRRFVNTYEKENYGPVYALLCNAGVNGKNTGLTKDGFDIVFETNHLGHFLLTKLMLPHIETNGKIFVTSSDMHDAPGCTMEWLGTEKLAHPDSSMATDSIRYAYSKLCNLYFVYELARRLKEDCNIWVNAFNPGLMQTNFMSLDNDFIEFVRHTMPKRFGDLEMSSDALAKLVTSEKIVTNSGLYYDRSINTCHSSALSYNIDNAKELWLASEAYVK